MEFVQGLCAGTVHQPQDLEKHIEFQCDVDEDRDIVYCALFKMAFLHWLNRAGHPQVLLQDGIVSEAIYQRQRQHSMLRALLFLRMCTEYSSQFIPTDIKIKVSTYQHIL